MTPKEIKALDTIIGVQWDTIAAALSENFSRGEATIAVNLLGVTSNQARGMKELDRAIQDIHIVLGKQHPACRHLVAMGLGIALGMRVGRAQAETETLEKLLIE